MGKKRKSRGRSKGGKGRSHYVQCSSCGKNVPIDKAKKVTRFVSLVDYRMAQELRKAGTYLPRTRAMTYYCISCSIHRHINPPRAKEERTKERKEEKKPERPIVRRRPVPLQFGNEERKRNA